MSTITLTETKQKKLEELKSILGGKQDILPSGVIEPNARSSVFWVFMQPDDQTPYVLGKEAVDKDWLPPKGVSALPKAIRDRVPKELRYWEVSGKEALDRRAKLAEMDVRELGGSSAKQLDWKPYVLQRHWFRGPIQVRFGASDQHYDLRIVLNGKHWHLVIDGNPLTNDRLPAYEETKYSGSVATADGKKINVLRIGTDPVELAPGQPANPTKDTPAFIQTVDEGEARLIDDQPEFKKIEFKGGKLRGAWYFRLESPDSKIGEFGKSEGPAVKAGEKYDPGQARDEAGRFSSGGGGYSFNFGEGRTREHRGLPRDYVNQIDGGPGPSVQYHGTSNRNATFSDAEVVYLQDKPTEAAGYARDLHRLGTPPKGGVQQREVLAIRRKPGYTASIDEEVSKAVDEGDDVDSVINAAASKAKEHGFRYVYFEHPTFSGEGQERVLVSLYPKSHLPLSDLSALAKSAQSSSDQRSSVLAAPKLDSG